MRHIFIAATAVMLLAGCQTTAVPTPAPIPSTAPTLLKLDGTNLANACTRVNTAIGYFNDLAWLIPEPYHTAGVLATQGVADFCTPANQAMLLSTGQNIVTVISKLDALWKQVQANTKAN